MITAKIFLFLMIIFALLAVQTKMLRRAVIYLGIFSMLSSFVYLLYQAPDVAIVEAIIGSTLTTILFLIALQKYKLFTLHYSCEGEKKGKEANNQSFGHNLVLDEIEKFCEKNELELQVVNTIDQVEDLKINSPHDIILAEKKEETTLYMNRENYRFGMLKDYLTEKGLERIKIIMFDEDKGD